MANQFAMTYLIQGLDPRPYRAFQALDDETLAARGIIRLSVTRPLAFPCRIRLVDLPVGETVLLMNHVSRERPSPYHASHAIFVGEGEAEAACFEDKVPPVLTRRVLSMRGFDMQDMMIDAVLVQPGGADDAIRSLFANPGIATIDIHNATRGCFAARAERT